MGCSTKTTCNIKEVPALNSLQKLFFLLPAVVNTSVGVTSCMYTCTAQQQFIAKISVFAEKNCWVHKYVVVQQKEPHAALEQAMKFVIFLLPSFSIFVFFLPSCLVYLLYFLLIAQTMGWKIFLPLWTRHQGSLKVIYLL